MSAIEFYDDGEISTGLTRNEIRLIAKRQFTASIAAAIVVVAAALAAAMMPASHDVAQTSQKRIVAVQKPTYASPLDQGVASARQGEIELP
jgi:hypothetical protein